MIAIIVVVLMSALCVGSPTLAERLCLEGDFNHQVELVLSYIRLPDEQLHNVTQVPKDLERIFKSRWPGSRILRFGSTVTGLALRSSDIDCFVDIPGDDKDPETIAVEALAILKKHSQLFKHFKIKPKFRVPLVTCLHIPTDIFVDISFSGPCAINSSRVISYLLHLDKRALDLGTILKYWGSVHNIANKKHTLSSYGMVLMTIFYLQQKNMLPSVAAVQQNVAPYEVEHWNVALQPVVHHTDNNETLYELLGGFFKYYSEFDFRNTLISPYVGYPIKRDMDLDKLIDFSTYKRNLANGFVEPFSFGYLNIQDILRHNENIARHYNVQRPALRLITQLRAAARMYETLSSEQFLSALLVPEKSVKDDWPGGIGAPADCIHREKTYNCLKSPRT